MDTIYLDHNATTYPHPEVIEAIAAAQREGFANPASQHQLGQRARREVEDAREEIGRLLGAEMSGARPDRVIFTSGGTEANNLAILGMARGSLRPQPGHLVISAIEHPSVIEPAEALLENGWRLDQLGVDGNGALQVERLEGLLKSNTALVSVILGNHDAGVIEPLAEVTRICASSGVPVHTDAVQAAGKIPIRFRQLGVAALSVAAHKFRGPLGIGALVVRDDVRLEPILFGGSQQGGQRPGTESVALVRGMLTALRICDRDQQSHQEHMRRLQQRLEAGLQAGYPGLVVHASAVARLPNTSNIAFPGIDGQVLLLALDMAGVACSVGSACSSGSTELSPTLRAMNLPGHLVASSLRFSLGATTTEAEIDEAVRRILAVCRELGGC